MAGPPVRRRGCNLDFDVELPDEAILRAEILGAR